MKVFLSWSGMQSKEFAIFFSSWLKDVIQSLEVFVSTETDKGIVWFDKIQSELISSNYCIICLTRSNIANPWINFEAGAIANKQEKTNVTAILINLSPSDVPPPLSLFQNTILNKDDIYNLLLSINRSNSTNLILEEKLLEKHFNKWWVDLEKKIKEINKFKEEDDISPKRSQQELLDELLDTTRINTNIMLNMKDSISKLLFNALNDYDILSNYDEILNNIPERDAELIQLYFGINKQRPASISEIAIRFNLTEEKITQLLIKSIKRFHENKSK